MDDRLYLSFVNKAATGISPVQATTSVFAKAGRLQVVGNVDIKEVQVVDMQGRMILKATNIGSQVYTHDLPQSNMYVVKVTTNEGFVVKKVIND